MYYIHYNNDIFSVSILQLHGCKPDSVGIKAQSQQMARDRGEDMGRGVRLEENFQP